MIQYQLKQNKNREVKFHRRIKPKSAIRVQISFLCSLFLFATNFFEGVAGYGEREEVVSKQEKRVQNTQNKVLWDKQRKHISA